MWSVPYSARIQVRTQEIAGGCDDLFCDGEEVDALPPLLTVELRRR